MKKIYFLLVLLVLNNVSLHAQKYFTKNGYVSFFSKAPLENIKAENNQVLNVLDIQSGDIQFSMLIKSFHFAKSLMEIHFNENYMESNRFPSAGFKGTITNLKEISFTRDGIYNTSVSGKMTIHGVTKNMNTSGTITVSGSSILLHAVFFVKLADYNISIPKIVTDKIAETVEVTVHTELDQKL